MKTKYTLFRRGEMFYMQDSATGKQTSLHTKDETEAKSLLEARNAAQRQPVLNLHLARAYLTASDPAFVERTWQVVMEQMQSRGNGCFFAPASTRPANPSPDFALHVESRERKRKSVRSFAKPDAPNPMHPGFQFF